jgi:hypothetical protein
MGGELMAKLRRKKVDDAQLRRLWASRMREADIAELLGHCRRTLRRRAIKLGLPSSRRELWRETAP